MTCAWHDADAVLLVEKPEVKRPPLGRKGNANHACGVMEDKTLTIRKRNLAVPVSVIGTWEAVNERRW